jgi:molybdenum cofactor synthesis domain-containing protein
MIETANPAEKIVTAGVLIIGNEILSGRTQDMNLAYIAKGLNEVGVTLREARMIPDVAQTIVATLNELRAKYDYVFTTGGIGPTHDDITAECIARAFGVELVLDPVAVELLKRGGRPLNEARLRMAKVPRGAQLIENAVSNAPGFRIGNVFVLAGIPAVARAMFAAAIPFLTGGAQIHSASVDVFLREGDFAEALERIALANQTVDIGSYPFQRDGQFGASLVVRGTDQALLERLIEEIVGAMAALGGATQRR